MTSLWRLPGWPRIYAAVLVSLAGDSLFDVTMAMWIGWDVGRGQPWAEAAVSATLVSAALPVLLVGPLAGVVAERIDRRRAIMLANAVQSVSIAALLPLVWLTGTVEPALAMAWIVATVFVSGAAGTLFAAASTVMVARVVPRELRTSAFSLQAASRSAVTLVAPAVGPGMFLVAGPGWAIGLNAVSYLVSALLLARVRWDSRPDRGTAGRRGIDLAREGWRFARTSPTVLALVTGLAVMALAGGAMSVLEVFFVSDVLGGSAAALTSVGVAFAVGLIAGSSAAPAVVGRFGARRALVAGVALAGVGLVLYSRQTDVVVAVPLLVLVALGMGTVTAVTGPLVIEEVPPGLLGRVSSLVNVLPATASLVGMAVSGWLVSGWLAGLDAMLLGTHLGPVDAVFLAAGGLFLVAAGAVTGLLRRA